LALALTLAAAPRLAAQQPAGLMGDLVGDVTEVQQKLVALAKAMPADKYAYRPGAGVRSFGEVMLHVASDNYFLPTVFGVAADASTGIKAGDYAGVQAYEKRALDREATVAELEKSFEHLKRAMRDGASSDMSGKVSAFGQSFTRQRMWVLTATHLHEHLGQSIAYARMNSITPPWSD
ncbi:MAG TPA: DinB family protein, partial [Gemmatimonadaceae bacterium]|nr:DinB family protein [Gemmatimonadaceae bacterium]